MDQVNNPTHYNQGKIEVIEAIEDWQLGFNLGNTVKYIARAGKKDKQKTVEDLEKAKWYLQRDIERIKAMNVDKEIKELTKEGCSGKERLIEVEGVLYNAKGHKVYQTKKNH